MKNDPSKILLVGFLAYIAFLIYSGRPTPPPNTDLTADDAFEAATHFVSRQPDWIWWPSKDFDHPQATRYGDGLWAVHGDFHHLGLIYRGNEPIAVPYTNRFHAVVKEPTRREGWKLISVSLDGKTGFEDDQPERPEQTP